MESTWQKAIDAGKKVDVDIKIIYDEASKRPKIFEVEYTIDGDDFFQPFSN